MFIEDTLPYSGTAWDFINQSVDNFFNHAVNVMTRLVQKYIGDASNSHSRSFDLQAFCQNILHVLCGVKSLNLISPHFLDLSILYEKEGQYFPVNIPAAFALTNVLRANFKSSSTESRDWIDLLDTRKEPDEKSRAFERVFAYTIISSEGINLRTTKLDRTGDEFIKLRADVMKFFNQVQEILPVEKPTLYVPTSRIFPALDLLLLTPEKVIMIQLTFLPPKYKVPHEGTSYSAIYSNEKYRTDLGDIFGEGGNLASHLLAFTKHPVKSVSLTANDLVDEKGNSVLQHFQYLICSTSAKKNIPHSEKFPWVRLVDRKTLRSWLPKETIALLPGSVNE